MERRPPLLSGCRFALVGEPFPDAAGIAAIVQLAGGVVMDAPPADHATHAHTWLVCMQVRLIVGSSNPPVMRPGW